MQSMGLSKLETYSLHFNAIYPNNFLEADLNILDFKTLFVSLRFEMRTLRNAGRVVQWMLCIITWAIKTGGTFYHVIFRHLGYFALGSIVTLEFVSSRGTFAAAS
jgi:hypothetical protein